MKDGRPAVLPQVEAVVAARDLRPDLLRGLRAALLPGAPGPAAQLSMRRLRVGASAARQTCRLLGQGRREGRRISPRPLPGFPLPFSPQRPGSCRAPLLLSFLWNRALGMRRKAWFYLAGGGSLCEAMHKRSSVFILLVVRY